jgi:chromosome segregation ATPase
VQRELSYIQDILHKSQRRMRYLEKNISSNEHNIHLHAMEQRSELDLRIEEIKRGYQEKLLQIQVMPWALWRFISFRSRIDITIFC